MFGFKTPIPEGYGGRTGLHHHAHVEKCLNSTPVGQKLLEKMRERGTTIHQGYQSAFLAKITGNYVRSWEERFGNGDDKVTL